LLGTGGEFEWARGQVEQFAMERGVEILSVLMNPPVAVPTIWVGRNFALVVRACEHVEAVAVDRIGQVGLADGRPGFE